MEFDRSGLRHRLSVAPFAPGDFSVFVLTDDGTVEHYWAGEGVMFGPEQLGGHFDSDPVAAWERDDNGLHLHLIGRAGIQIVDWHWDLPARTGFLGAPAVETLPGFCVTDPEVVNSGQLQVFAVGVEGTLRHWSHSPEGWAAPGSLGTDIAQFQPAAISRGQGLIDVFAVSNDNNGLRHWSNADGPWTSNSRGGEQLIGRPTVASYETNRLDLFAVRSDGIPLHWGWNGTRWFDAEPRLTMTFGLASSIVATSEVHLVSFGVQRLILLACSTDKQLAEWTFQPPDRWDGVNPIGRTDFPFAAWSAQEGQVDTLSRNGDGSFTHNFFVIDPDGGMGEPVPGSWDGETLALAEPEPFPMTLTPTPVDPDMILVRSQDLVLLGVRWSGFEVAASPGVTAELVAGAGAELTVIFPPQHVVEEVVFGAGPHVPSLDPATTGGFPTWQAALSGPSRVVVGLQSGDRVALTAEGVLDAVRRGRVRPSDGTLDGLTALEIPFGLVLSPHEPDNREIRCAHPARVVVSGSGSVGVWQTNIAADTTAAGAPAGLVLRPISASSTDPFPVPLPGGSRARVALEAPTARIDRLMLSALGGSLTASGSWDTFEWSHVAALGRDRRVRTATRGVMYPFGHRAEYVEVTERIFESTAAGAIAHLQKSTSLRITEPVRREPVDAALKAAFPFSEVALEKTFFDNLAAPVWATKDFPTPELAGLELASDQWRSEQSDLYEKIFGDMGPGVGAPSLEDLAFGQSDDAEDLLDPEDPESGTRAAAARSYLEMEAQVAHINAQIAALAHGGVQPLPLYFVPRLRQAPPEPAIQFPVRLAGRIGDVHVSMPLVFVADVKRGNGLLAPAFASLTDDGTAGRLATTYTAEGDGVVDTNGARIDLVRSNEPVPGDVCEVTRLHVVGVTHDGGFRPRLGAAPQPAEQRVPPAERWGFETVLPAMRTLLGGDRPPLRMALSRALLDAAPDLKIPFQVPEGAEKLVTDFARNSARSGGIVAPDIVADGLSRIQGPVSVAGLLDSVQGKLDPKKILGEGASLLGYSLADLIDATELEVPPEILTAVQAGEPPKVTLQWNEIKLNTATGSFVTGPESQMDIDVVVGVEGQKVKCTVDNVVLALPDRNEKTKLLEVTFGQIVFKQEGGNAPTLDVSGVGAKFFGVLDLLKELQDAVDLGSGAPHIDASSNGVTASYTLPVPDVTAGAFQMTGLVFHAGIDVPFDNRPVTISLAFANRQKPFNLSVLMFGGGGYVDVVIDKTGLRRLEVALEFGASISVNFVVAFGEVHAMGGVRLVKDGDTISLGGYLRFGGSVSVLGLITASVELTVTLTYRDSTNQMVGRATLVLEVDLTLFSESVELDTGDWVLVGGESVSRDIHGRPTFGALPGVEVPEEWRRYRSAFAPEPVR